MIRIVARRGRGSYKDQLDEAVAEQDFICVDCTSMSRNSEFPKGDLSPLLLGPVDCYDGLVSKTMGNAWQYAKVYPRHADAKGAPTEKYFRWRDGGFARRRGDRYPMEEGVKPLYTYWKVDGEYRQLDDIEARKQIYIPEYAKLFVKTKTYGKLMRLHAAGRNILLADFDGYNHRHPDFAISYNEVIHYPFMPMGHAFVIAMLLEGMIKVRGDEVEYAEGLMDPPDHNVSTRHEMKSRFQGVLATEGRRNQTRRRRVRYVPDLCRTMANTIPEFLKDEIAPILGKAFRKTGEELSGKDQEAFAKFDRIYRPYVYNALLQPVQEGGMFGFSRREDRIGDVVRITPVYGDISGEEIWLDLCRILAGGNKLATFDFEGRNVGNGGFRDYLKQIAFWLFLRAKRKCARMAAVRKTQAEAVTKEDEEGHSSYDPARKEEERAALRLDLFEHYIAYVSVLKDTENKKAFPSWMREAVREIFENGVNRKEVLADCIKRKKISRRSEFDLKLNRFRTAVKETVAWLRKNRMRAVNEDVAVDLAWSQLVKKVGRDHMNDLQARIFRFLK